MKEQELKYYKQFAEFLNKYEDSQDKSNVALGSYQTVRLVSGDTQSHLKNKLDTMANELENPFIHIRNWIKGEMFNLGALISSIAEKESCDVRKQEAIKKLSADREYMKKLSEGKFHIKGLFKSSSSKVKKQTELLEKIAQTERDIENWDTVKRFLIVYLAEIAIPEFRQTKVYKYVTAMQGFSKMELMNAERHQLCWHDFYDLTRAHNF